MMWLSKDAVENGDDAAFRVVVHEQFQVVERQPSVGGNAVENAGKPPTASRQPIERSIHDAPPNLGS
jgi:hypothetical protein